jgi:hypothetical protein
MKIGCCSQSGGSRFVFVGFRFIATYDRMMGVFGQLLQHR